MTEFSATAFAIFFGMSGIVLVVASFIRAKQLGIAFFPAESDQAGRSSELTPHSDQQQKLELRTKEPWDFSVPLAVLSLMLSKKLRACNHPEQLHQSRFLGSAESARYEEVLNALRAVHVRLYEEPLGCYPTRQYSKTLYMPDWWTMGEHARLPAPPHRHRGLPAPIIKATVQ